MDHNCEVRIIKAKNIDTKSNGVIFVRCYLHTGKSSRVRLDSKESPSNSDSITWNQTFSLRCSGSQECLKQGTLIFELRQRSAAAPFIGRIQGSRLIGRAGIPWEDIVTSTNMEVEEWVNVTRGDQKRRVYNDIINPPAALQVAVKLRECSSEGVVRKSFSEEKCGCNSCVDYEFFCH